jgi:hypothetical protein
MVVHDLDIVSVALLPDEADPPLIIDTDTVLTSPLPLKSLQPVTRRQSQILQRPRCIQLAKPLLRSPQDIGREAFQAQPAERSSGTAIPKRFDHPW